MLDFYKQSDQNFIELFKDKDSLAVEMQEIQSIFNDCFRLLAKPDYIWSLVFLRRSWSLFLSAVRIGGGGQSPDVYPLLSTMLESALYSWYINQDVDRLSIWLKRCEGADSKVEVRKLFSYGKIIKELEEKYPEIAKSIKKSYEFLIDFGAHPNFSSIMSGISERGLNQVFDLPLIHKRGENSFELGLEKTVQVGLESLELFRITFPDEFKSINLDKKIIKAMIRFDVRGR